MLVWLVQEPDGSGTSNEAPPPPPLKNLYWILKRRHQTKLADKMLIRKKLDGG